MQKRPTQDIDGSKWRSNRRGGQQHGHLANDEKDPKPPNTTAEDNLERNGAADECHRHGDKDTKKNSKEKGDRKPEPQQKSRNGLPRSKPEREEEDS